MELAYKGDVGMKYYRDENGAVRHAILSGDVLIDVDTGRRVPGNAEPLWTVRDAAEDWNQNENYVRSIMKKVPGAQRHMESPNVIWLIPAGSKNPNTGRPGPKPRNPIR